MRIRVSKSRWSDLIELLDKANVGFEDGLTDLEIARTEETYGFRFPHDLREFLQTALPTGFGFPNWRSGDERALREQLALPLHGILFDVERDGFWLPEWGSRPEELDEAKELVRAHVRAAPTLIPVNCHRMMPDGPHMAGNPILSVHQTDIIYYGFDLEDYLRHEFNLADRKPWPATVKAIEFWDVEFWDVERWQVLRWS